MTRRKLSGMPEAGPVTITSTNPETGEVTTSTEPAQERGALRAGQQTQHGHTDRAKAQRAKRGRMS